MSIIGSLSVGIPGAGGMIFRNKPVQNLQYAVYVLALRGPQAPYPLITSYIFPISPESMLKSSRFLTSSYDTAGTPQQLGVSRVIDTYGQTPVTYQLAGTTGWQLHGTDGFSLTGQQSIQQLQSVLNTFSSKNAQQIAAGNPQLYRMEIYDYFNNEYWQVVPYGGLSIRQDARRPMLQYYELVLMGVMQLSSAPPPPVDAIASSFGASISQASTSLSASLGGTAGLYVGVTIPVR